MSAYYNEHDRFAAQWLRNLIAAGHIAPGDVDERSIVDVRGDELVGYDQCHFFAGIGGWSHALRLAGVPDDYPVWTGSCPCQPFSAAGKRQGAGDERHLWPDFYRLIRECRPALVFGEQVASAEVVGKQSGIEEDLREGASPASESDAVDSQGEGESEEEEDGIRARLLRAGIAEAHRCGLLRGDGTAVESGWRAHLGQSVDRPDRYEAGISIPEHPDRLSRHQHRDERLGRAVRRANGSGDFVSEEEEVERLIEAYRRAFAPATGWPWLDDVRLDLERSGYAFGACVFPACSVGAPHIRQRVYWVADDDQRGRTLEQVPQLLDRERAAQRDDADGCGATGGLADAESERRGGGADSQREGPTGFWRDAQWLPCIDGKARPAIPPSQLLAAGFSADLGVLCPSGTFPNRVGLLRAFGNAIVLQQAAEFVRAWLNTTEGEVK